LKVDVSRTKAIRAEILRVELTIPQRLWPSTEFAEYIQMVQDWISARETATMAPENTEARSLNKYLDAAWSGMSGRHPTSYTFRRAAFHRFIEDCRDSDGVVDWARVSRFSLHLNEKTVRAFYHLGVGKSKRSE